MGVDNFLHFYKLLTSQLVNREVNGVLNSIGSNIFLDFGQEEKIVYKNGRVHYRKEWTIWISNASWRISQDDRYVVGSVDFRDTIQSGIEKLMRKKIRNLKFLSSFLDVEFIFDHGYKITTFFDWMRDDQWAILPPKQIDAEMGLNCVNHEEIKKVQGLSKSFIVEERYKKHDFPLLGSVIDEVVFHKDGVIDFYFNNSFILIITNSAWRLEKDQEYLTGDLDEKIDNHNRGEKLQALVGEKIEEIGIANAMMDARFLFSNGYALKTFTCWRDSCQWEIFYKLDPIFSPRIELLKGI